MARSVTCPAVWTSLALSAAGAGGSAAGSAQARSTAPTQKASAQEAEAPARPKISGAEQCSTKESVRLSVASPSSLQSREKLSEQMSARCLGLCRFGRSGRAAAGSSGRD